MNKMRNARINHIRIEHSRTNTAEKKDQRNEKVTSGQSEVSTMESSYSTKEIKSSNQISKAQKLNTEITGMDRENFYHWGATREIMEIIRRRNNSPETRRLKSRETSFPGQEHCDTGTTTIHNGQYSHHQDLIKEVEKKSLRLTRKS